MANRFRSEFGSWNSGLMNNTTNLEERPRSAAAVWQFAGAELDEGKRELRVNGELVGIEPRPLSVLLRLLQCAGEVATKDELIEAVYGHTHITDGALTNSIGRLRKLLRDDQQQIIVTVHRVGYRLATPVHRKAVVAELPPVLGLVVNDAVPKRENWRLVRSLGERRDSEVWLACQQKTGEQRVYKFAPDGGGLSALKREVTLARVLKAALGSRSDIVTPVDWNFESPPFFVESHYAGESIPSWAETQGGIAAVPLALRINFLARTAEAIAAAHSVGVLHKDLKPSNVLIAKEADGDWAIRVVDFGSGRLLDPNLLAQFAITQHDPTAMATADSGSGTFRYLAPEVLSGQLPTAQADVFALGVMLYELVVGDLHKTLSAGWEKDVDDELLREDIADAAEGNPLRRLTDAGELARRLRSLDTRRQARLDAQRERVEAQQERERLQQAQTALERLRLRRRRTTALITILAAGLVWSGVMYQRASRAEKSASREAAHARAVSDFLNRDLFATISADDRPVRELTVKQLLDTASSQVEKRFADDHAAAADVHASLGYAYRAIDLSTDARRELAAAMTQYFATEGPGSETQLRLAGQMIQLDYVLNQLAETLPSYKVLRDQAEVKLGSTAEAVARFNLELARANAFLGQWSATVTELNQLVIHLADSDPTSDIRLSAMQILSAVQLKRGDAKDAEPAAQAVLRGLVARGSDDHYALARAHATLGMILTELNRYDDATTELTQASTIAEHWEPNGGDSVAFADIGWARLLIEKGQPQRAIERLQHSIDRWMSKPRSAKEQNSQLIFPRRELARALLLAGKTAQASTMINLALEATEATYAPGFPTRGLLEQEAAQIRFAAGDTDAACATFGQPPPPWLAETAPTHPAQLERIRLQGLCARAQGKLGDAKTLLKSARDQFVIRYGTDHWRTRQVETELSSTSAEH
jgi:DNA-binding winged helix-turn-helix (wHTH) protein